MQLFYTRKYSVYNLTFNESINLKGYCYTWGVKDGKRGSNEVSTKLDKRNETPNVYVYTTLLRLLPGAE